MEAFQDGHKNPYGRSGSWVVNDAFLLKSDELLLYDQKQQEGKLVSFLEKNGIPVLLSLEDKIVREKDRVYQLFPYVHQQDQGRIDYREELNKAGQAGTVLAAVTNMGTKGLDGLLWGRQPPLKETIEDLCGLLSTSDSQIALAAQLAHDHLKENLFPFLPYWEQRFSHGDLHPGNLLWGPGAELRAVIDWELAGTREELYDLAFLIGCVGMDNPLELLGEWTRELIISFLGRTQTTKLSFELLPELVLATRIHWMQVWLQNPQDAEIALMEAAYWRIIIDNSEKMRSEWKACQGGDFKYSENRWVVQDASLVEEICQAKKRQEGVDIFSHALWVEDIGEAEQLSTDLRLMSIDSGMNDDIRSVCALINLQGRLLEDHPESDYINIERSLTMGNSTLDFSKFRMMKAVHRMLKECEELMNSNPSREELRTGYAFALRNSSIAMAEVGEYDQALEAVETHIQLSRRNHENLEIKEELARTLSNALASIIGRDKDGMAGDPLNRYASILEELYGQHPESRKIRGAYLVAEKNLAKARGTGKFRPRQEGPSG